MELDVMTAACLMTTYQPLALSFSKGLGTRLWDQAGREYLDAVAGVAVTNVGHSHPKIVSAISEQAGLLLHTSNLYSIDWQQRLAQKLTQLAGMERAFFNNSGAEANETALKLARLYGWHKGIEQPLVVVMENAFHGRTLGTLSASDGPAVRLGFNELPGDFVKVPFGDLKALDKVQQAHGPRIVAILMEPIQGESGVQMAPPGYLKAIRERCTRHAWLLMLDEIQTGIGRTGQWFAFQHEGIVPDVMTLAKGWATVFPSAPVWPGAKPPISLPPAVTAAPSAAIHWPAASVAPCWRSSKNKGCWKTPNFRASVCSPDCASNWRTTRTSWRSAARV
jgi:Ornithine/acetylornithine aminotransferase